MIIETHINLHNKTKEELITFIEDSCKIISKKDKYIDVLETKLMYALTPTKHELAKRTQEEFKEIIRNNIEEDTYTIKRLLKEDWNNL